MKNKKQSARALMAGAIASTGIALLNYNAFASDGIKCGDRVLEDLGEMSVQTVMAISESGKYLLTDGKWYWSDYLKPVVTKETHAGIKAGDTVMEYSSSKTGRRFQKVLQIINDGVLQLEDGKWYSNSDITPTVAQYKGLNVNQEVIELTGTETTQTIQHIASDGMLLLSDGEVYFASEVEPLSEGKASGSLSTGQWVMPKYEEQFSILKINRFSKSGLIELSNGVWYQNYEISPLVETYENFRIGDPVIDYGQPSEIETITHISEYGIFRLSSGRWKYAGHLEKVTCLPSTSSQQCSSK